MKKKLHEDKSRVVDKNGNTNYVLIKKGNQDYLVASGSQVQSTEKALSAYVEVLGLTPASTIALGENVIFSEQAIEAAKQSIAAGKDMIIPIMSTTVSGAGHKIRMPRQRADLRSCLSVPNPHHPVIGGTGDPPSTTISFAAIP